MVGTHKLTEMAVKQAKPREKQYKLADGGSMYLCVMPNGSKYWRLKYRYGGREKAPLALGVYPAVSLAMARDKAREAKILLAAGSDPAFIKKHDRLVKQSSQANTFEAVAAEWFAKESLHWSDTHKVRTLGLLNNNLGKWLCTRPISEITSPELLAVLRRTEARGIYETAKRALQVAGQVFRYAVATGRAERNPATDLKGALTSPKGKHFAAITDPTALGALLVAMDGYSGTPEVKTALLLSPLLFQRPSEIRRMEWAEINWEEERLELPAEKMKMRKPHVVPLPSQALNLLRALQPLTGEGRYVFPSARGGSRPLSENGVRTALRALGYTNAQQTPHGFRATARTILDEVLGYRVDLIEHQLAHTVKDANGTAYNRTKHLPARKAMMQGWADYLDNLRSVARGENVLIGQFHQGNT